MHPIKSDLRRTSSKKSFTGSPSTIFLSQIYCRILTFFSYLLLAVLALLLVFGSFFLEEPPDTPGTGGHTQTDQHCGQGGDSGEGDDDEDDVHYNDDYECEILW